MKTETPTNKYLEFRDALADDPDWAWSWHCNIAMAACDEGVDRETADKITRRFMRLAYCFHCEQREDGKIAIIQ